MRRPVVSYAFAVLALLGVSCASHAQETSYDPVQFVPRVDLSLGFQFIHSNAPPGIDQKFRLYGGYASVGVKYKYGLSFAGEVTGTHANDISLLGQNLTLMTYTAGPRATLRGRRSVIFGQALFGAAHGGDSYFPTATSYTTSATSFAMIAGGGLDVELGHRFAVRPIEAQFLHTDFNNGVNTSQNQFMLSAGVVFKYRGHYATPHYHVAKALPPAKLFAPPPPPPAEPPVAAAAPESPTPAPAPGPDGGFHEHVRDAYFDYDKWELRPDTQQAIVEAAAYLQAHPEIHVLVGGFSDERGTPEFNLALGEKRANAARDALVQAGVDASRITIVSYGKGVQVCTIPAEACYQRNRRVAFMPQP